MLFVNIQPNESPRVFVIEGTDGSGKASHVELLRQWLEAQGYQVVVFDFPQYGQPSARDVEAYLAGEYGQLNGEAGARQASRFYAADRLAATPAINSAVAAGMVVLCNRYIASNLAHQGGKIEDEAARHQFYAWCELLEYNQLGAVPPTMTFVLRMPTKQAQSFVDLKAERAHLGGRSRDLHEADLGHLTSAARGYLELCQLFPDDYTLIECVDRNGQLQDIGTINQKIRQAIGSMLEKGQP